MKKSSLFISILFIVVSLFCVDGCNKGPKYDDVYLIMGQSNASGNSPWRYLETKDQETYDKFINGGPSNVVYSYDNVATKDATFQTVKFGTGDNYHGVGASFGPEIGMADILSKRKETTYIIKAACSGTSLTTQWLNFDHSRNELYISLVDFIVGQLGALKKDNKNPRIKGVLWVQGESDSIYENIANLYKDSLVCFINYLREYLSDYIFDYMNFVDVLIDINDPENKYPNIINNAKKEVANELEHCYYIKTNGEDEESLSLSSKAIKGEEDGDYSHYDSLSMVALGREAIKYMDL